MFNLSPPLPFFLHLEMVSVVDLTHCDWRFAVFRLVTASVLGNTHSIQEG